MTHDPSTAGEIAENPKTTHRDLAAKSTSEEAPTSVFSIPLVRVSPESLPTAELLLPVAFRREFFPKAQFDPPVILFRSAAKPNAELLPPEVLRRSAPDPKAELSIPVVLDRSAFAPRAEQNDAVVLD
jgi:hypothetical protein